MVKSVIKRPIFVKFLGIICCMGLYYMRTCDIMSGMKLYYDRKSKDPTYFIQQGYRNGSKTSTRNILLFSFLIQAKEP